jgi:hypothetical protein
MGGYLFRLSSNAPTIFSIGYITHVSTVGVEDLWPGPIIGFHRVERVLWPKWQNTPLPCMAKLTGPICR